MYNILCYGDSNTLGINPVNGERLPREFRWPGRLEDIIGRKYKVYEDAVSGRTTCYVPAKGQEDKNGFSTLQASLRKYAPIDLVIVMLGTNDLKMELNVSPQDVANNMDMYIRTIKSYTAQIQEDPADVLIIAPPPLGEDLYLSEQYGKEFGASARYKSLELGDLFEQVANNHGVMFFDAGRVAQVSDFDQLHLGVDGHKNIAEVVAAIVKYGEKIRDPYGFYFTE